MQSFSARRLAAVLALSGALTLQSACSNDPTSENGDQPSFATTSTLTLGGPESIHVSGRYTYGAYFLVPYATFSWWTRTCNTLTVATCAASWVPAADVVKIDSYRTQITRSLTYNCGFKAPKSFQVKVTGGGFGVIPQTVYKVTNLCGTNPA